MPKHPKNPPPEFNEVYQTWQVDRLLSDIIRTYSCVRKKKSEQIYQKTELSPTIRDYLLLLLAGKSPTEIAGQFCKQPTQTQKDTVRHRLSKELYPAIAELLTQRSILFNKLQWNAIPDLLAKAGYKLSPQPTQTNSAITPSEITLLLQAGLKQHLLISEQYQTWDWSNNYTQLAHNWSDIELYIKWCNTPERYQALKILLQNTRQYTYIYGCWQKRWEQVEALLQVIDLGDAATIAEAKVEKGWLLTLSNHWQEATRLWEQISLQSDPVLLLKIAKNQAVWSLQQQLYPQALEYLQQARLHLQRCHLDPERLQKWEIILDYYEPQIYFRQGKYPLAKSLYQQAWERTRQLGWHRMSVAFQNWMACLAMIEGNLHQARYWLEQGLNESRQYNDLQCIACYNLSLARLEKLEGNLSKSRFFATQALTDFTALKMLDRIANAQKFLSDISETEM